MKRRGWELPESQATPEKVFWNRREVLAAMAAAGGVGVLAPWAEPRALCAQQQSVIDLGRQEDPAAADLYPAETNPDFDRLDRPISDEEEVASYNNFYEFTPSKEVYRHVGAFRPNPWEVEVAGLVARPGRFDLDDFIRAFTLEERLYRHRCVEAWAMAVPWTGFPLRELLRRVEPAPAARYVRFVSFDRPEQAPNQRPVTPPAPGREDAGGRRIPWPYTEGLTLAEAANELALLATGMYGHPLLKQNGAPIRLVVPWKYGFKSIKAVTRIELVAERPATFWNTLVPDEYGFEANVDPAVPHPRWSQRHEQMLGTGEVRATLPYNGYGEWVAELYR